jgi:hypothetical protein
MPKVRPNKPLADVNVLPQDNGDNTIVVCFQPNKNTIWGKPEADAKAVLSIDASKSIIDKFGLNNVWGGGVNEVEMVSRKIGSILCDVSKKADVSMNYWAIGPGGTETEVIQDGISKAECSSIEISGPKQHSWGTGTKILPTIKHIVEEHLDKAEAAFGVIITDGIIEDEDEAMAYCMDLGRRLVDENLTELFKLVLIGVGTEVDSDQLDRFDNMFEETELEDDVDIWGSGVATDMKDESDIMGVLFGEMMSEETIIAPSGTVSGGSGNVVQNFSDGMPGKFRFTLPKGETSFKIHAPNGDVTQDISEAL